MHKGLCINNLLAGLVLLIYWIYDYHYVPRLSKKIPTKIMSNYQNLRANLRSEISKVVPKEFDRDDFYYVYNDTFYIELFNYQNLNETTFESVSHNLRQIIASKFKGIHDCLIFVKGRKMRKDEHQMLEELSDFQESQIKTQNFYYIRLINDDYSDSFTLFDNIAWFNIPYDKISDSNLIRQVMAKSVYHFKKLGKLGSIEFKHGKEGVNEDIFEKLRYAYVNVLKMNAVKYIDGLEYINANKNLVFKSDKKGKLAL